MVKFTGKEIMLIEQIKNKNLIMKLIISHVNCKIHNEVGGKLGHMGEMRTPQ